jgi:metal-responsive CopG/Arc/MetJ family transcriptional regulator
MKNMAEKNKNLIKKAGNEDFILDEKNTTIKLPVSLLKEINRQYKKRGTTKKRAVRTAMEVWLQFEETLQAKLMDLESSKADYLVTIYTHLQTQMIQEGRKSPKRLLKQNHPRQD